MKERGGKREVETKRQWEIVALQHIEPISNCIWTCYKEREREWEWKRKRDEEIDREREREREGGGEREKGRVRDRDIDIHQETYYTLRWY